jgi:hypothetical protein
MPDVNMNQEQEISHISEREAISERPSLSHDLPIIEITDQSPHAIRFPDIFRRANIQQVREEESGEKFLADVDFSQRLRDISDVFPYTSITNGNAGEYYNSEQLKAAYVNAPDTEKRKFIRTRLKHQIDTRKRDVYGILEKDIQVLFEDEGFTPTEIDERIKSLTTGMVGNKRKNIYQLPQNSQIALLENMAELRINTLVRNFDQYMYFLSFSNWSREDKEINEGRRQKFSQATTLAEKAKIAAETRKLAEAAMQEVFKAEVGATSSENGRLGSLELMAGIKMPEIKHNLSSLRLRYAAAALPERARILFDIHDKKINLALPWLRDVISLRRSIEKDLEFEKNSTGDLTQEQRLQEEAEQVIHLIAAQEAQDNNLGEATVDETRKRVEDIARKFENPNLIKTYELVLLLRTSPKDYFKL